VNIGAENRNKLIASVGLSVLALLLVGRLVFSASSSPAPAVPSRPPAVTKAVARGTLSRRKIDISRRSLDPTLRYDWLKASEDTKYEGAGRNIFRAEAEIPTPIAPGGAEAGKEKAQTGPPQPAPPPPINLKFFGFATKPGEPKKIFLSQGEDIFVAAEGDIIDRRYRILHIGPASVEIEDVLNNNRQSIPLTQG
jgi:hypothetical protein